MKYAQQTGIVGSLALHQFANNGYNETIGIEKADAANSRIRDGVTYLETQLSELHSLLSSLEGRLETVTTPVPPQPASVSQQRDANGPVSHLFDRLQGLSSTVNEAHVRVRSLLSRIEV